MQDNVYLVPSLPNPPTVSYAVARTGATAGAFLNDVHPFAPTATNPTTLLFPAWNVYPYAAAAAGFWERRTRGKVVYDLVRFVGGLPLVTPSSASRPLDVRVEALIYAQEGSFFLIPGPWFNPEPQRYLRGVSQPNGSRATATHGGRCAGDDSFPQANVESRSTRSTASRRTFA